MSSRRFTIATLAAVFTVLLILSYQFGWFSRMSLRADGVDNSIPGASLAQSDSDRGNMGASGLGSSNSAVVDPVGERPLVPLGVSDQELATIGGGIEAIAYSREEADWLERNGYPTLEQLAALDAEPFEELQARAASGRAVDLALLAHKRVRLGQCASKVQAMECAESYRQAAVRGSLWAMSRYVSTAKYFATDLDDETRRWIEAHELVAERLGLHDEMTEAQNQQLRQLRGDDDNLSELVDEVLASINTERGALGLAPWARDPRPGEARQRALNDYMARSIDSSGQPRPGVRRYHYPRQ
jgi:hypothetical protein